LKKDTLARSGRRTVPTPRSFRVIPRRLQLRDFDTVFLEDSTWNALCEIARARGSAVDELRTDIAATDPARSEASRLSRCVVRRPLQCRRRIGWNPVEFVGPITVDAARMSRSRSQGAIGRASRQTSQLHRGFFDAIADEGGNGQGTWCWDRSIATGICAT
jgi:predicted DNA-binding ribbon-helix-helix protein